MYSSYVTLLFSTKTKTSLKNVNLSHIKQIRTSSEEAAVSQRLSFLRVFSTNC